MNKGLIGKKLGVTQLFEEDGVIVDVTVLEMGPCTVIQKKTLEKDSYKSLQLGYQDKKKTRINKPEAGHFKNSKTEVKRHIKEFKFSDTIYDSKNVGDKLDISQFIMGDYVDVTAVSKGKGFAGVMKRHNFAGHSATHGTHESFRGGGSIGMCATPSRVLKGKKMPGQMGNKSVTVQNIFVHKVDADRNLLYVRGHVPGGKNGIVFIKDSVKRPSYI